MLPLSLHHVQSATGVLCRGFTREDLTEAFFQEPWVNKSRIQGVPQHSCKLAFNDSQFSPRAAISLYNNCKCFPISKFIKEDFVAVSMEVPPGIGSREILVVSAYFPGDVDENPCAWSLEPPTQHLLHHRVRCTSPYGKILPEVIICYSFFLLRTLTQAPFIRKFWTWLYVVWLKKNWHVSKQITINNIKT